MDERTFVRTLDLCVEYGSAPYIGGGEPTVHPRFWQFLGLMLGRAHEFEMEMVGMHTNGKRTADALALAALARRGLMGVTLSTDHYHEAIDQRAVDAFTKKARVDRWDNSWGTEKQDPHDLRGTADGADRSVVAQGRGKRIAGARADYCTCPDVQVDPAGVIWACGCKRTRFGTVWDPRLPEGAFEMTCWERAREDEDEDRREKLKADALATDLARGVSGDLIAM